MTAAVHKFAENARKGIANELERPVFVETFCSAMDHKKVIEGVHFDMFFPIVVDSNHQSSTKGVWNSPGWNATHEDSDFGWAVKLGILLAEDRELGVPSFEYDKVAHPQQYNKVLFYHVEDLNGRLSSKEKAWLIPRKSHTKMMDWTVYNDICQIQHALAHSDKKRKAAYEHIMEQINAAGVPQREPLIRDIDALRAELAHNPMAGGVWGGHPIPGVTGLNENDQLVANVQPFVGEGVHRYRQNMDNELFDPCLPAPQHDQEYFEEPEEAEEGEENDELGVDAADVDVDVDAAAAHGGDGRQPFVPIERENGSKVQVTLTAVPTVDAGTGYETKRLYVLRVTVIDPTINVPTWMAKLNLYCEKQLKYILDNEKRGGAGRRQGFSFRFENHDRVMDTDHPVFNFNQSRYIKCAATFNGDATIRTRTKVIFKRELHDDKSVLHPANVFSFENTSRILQEHGADPTFVNNKDHWLNRAGNDTTAHFPEGTATFTYPPETVFWCSPTQLGLMEQTFPQRSSHSELYSAMLRGEQIDDTLTREQNRRDGYNRVMASARNAHDALMALRQQGLADLPLMDDQNSERGADGLSERERIAVQRRVIDREEVTSARMMDYLTGNRMVHQAYEADAVYKNLLKLYPDNGPEIYARCQPYVREFSNYWMQKLNSEDKAALHAAYKEGGTKAKALETGWAEFIPNKDRRRRIVATFHLHRNYWQQMVREQKPDLYDDVVRYDKYRLALKIVQDGCLDRFSQLFRLDGRVDNLPISDGIKAVLKWFNKHLGENRQITRSRPFCKKDPGLTFFATDMAKYMTIYGRVARVVQPKVPLIAEGFLSCYDWTPGEINFHVLMHGRFDLGKTYQLLTVMLKFSSIPGRVREESRSTSASKDAGVHTYDETLAMDECPNWITNSKAQENNAELVNQMKQRMTNKRSHLLSFERTTMPDGSTRRDTARYTTDDTSCMACVTNNVVEKTAALTSRFFTVVMKDVGVSVLDTQFKTNPELKDHSRVRIQLNEFTSAAGKKAAMCGAILRDVNMKLWNDVSKRIIQYLEQNKMIPKDSGYRPIQIMVPVLRQFVYHRAALLTWHIPGAPHFNEPFELSHLQTMQRYLYVDLQLIIFVWTLLGSQYVDGDNSTVLAAAVKTAGVEYWGEGSNTYDIYVNKQRTNPRFRRVRNPDYQAPTTGGTLDGGQEAPDVSHNPGDRFLLDLNYVTIEGTSLYNIYDSIASDTPANNKIAANDIQGILGVLSERQMQPPRNGFERLPEGTFAEQHCKVYQRADDTWRKREYEYMANDGTPQFRVFTEDDVRPLRPRGQVVTLPVVEIEKPQRVNGKYKVHVAPWAIYRFKEEVIEAAFEFVVLTPHIPRKKMITGRTHPADPSLFACIDFTNEQYVTEYVRMMAEEEQRPVGYTRYDGTVFARDEVHTTPELEMLEEELDGVTLKQRSDPYELVTDLEYYSALDQHICCGLPLDMPVDCPRTIEQRYDASCSIIGLESFKRGLEYPRSFVTAKKSKKRQKDKMVTADVGNFSAQKMLQISMLRKSANSTCNGFDNEHDANAGEAPPDGYEIVTAEQLAQELEQVKRKRDKGKGEEIPFEGHEEDDGQSETMLIDDDTTMGTDGDATHHATSPSSKRSRLDSSVTMSNKDMLFDSLYD